MAAMAGNGRGLPGGMKLMGSMNDTATERSGFFTKVRKLKGFESGGLPPTILGTAPASPSPMKGGMDMSSPSIQEAMDLLANHDYDINNRFVEYDQVVPNFVSKNVREYCDRLAKAKAKEIQVANLKAQFQQLMNREAELTGGGKPPAAHPELSTASVAANAVNMEPTATEAFAAVVMVDVSGYSTLTSTLSDQGAIGAEILSKTMKGYLDKIIQTILLHGGDIVKFAGDAVIFYWKVKPSPKMSPADEEIERGEVVLKACHCCMDLLNNLGTYHIDVPQSSTDTLRIHLGIGAGKVFDIYVGGNPGRWEHFIAGDAVSQLSHVLDLAKAGELAMSHQALKFFSGVVNIDTVNIGDYDKRCIILHGLENAKRKISAPSPKEDEDLALWEIAPVEANVELYKKFINQSALYKLQADINQCRLFRAESGLHGLLSLHELRQVTTVFIKLGSLSRWETKEQLVEAQEAMNIVQAALNRYEGSLRQFHVDDKGATILCFFGLPPLAHENDAEYGIKAAMEICEEFKIIFSDFSIGMTTGIVSTGGVGNAIRTEYAVMGDSINMAARLMCHPEAHLSILVDQRSFNLCERILHFDSLGEVKVKGKTRPIAIFRPKELRIDPGSHRVSVHRNPADIIGRLLEKELVARTLSYSQSDSEAKAPLVIMMAEGGQGLSSMVDYTKQAVVDRVMLACTGSTTEMERSTPFYSFREIIKELFAILEDAILDDDHKLQLAGKNGPIRSAPDIKVVGPGQRHPSRGMSNSPLPNSFMASNSPYSLTHRHTGSGRRSSLRGSEGVPAEVEAAATTSRIAAGSVKDTAPRPMTSGAPQNQSSQHLHKNRWIDEMNTSGPVLVNGPDSETDMFPLNGTEPDGQSHLLATSQPIVRPLIAKRGVLSSVDVLLGKDVLSASAVPSRHYLGLQSGNTAQASGASKKAHRQSQLSIFQQSSTTNLVNSDTTEKDAALISRIHKVLTNLDDPAAAHFDMLGLVIPSMAHNVSGPMLQPGRNKAKEMAELLKRLINILASHSQLVLIFHEVQWMDPLSFELLQDIITGCPHIIVFCFSRPERFYEVEETKRAFMKMKERSGRPTTVHTLLGLTRDETKQMILSTWALCTGTMASNVNPQIVNELYQKTEGSPLYIRSIVYAVKDSGMWRVMEDGVLSANTNFDLERVAVGYDLQSIVIAQFDRLDRSFQLFLKVASVLGQQFYLEDALYFMDGMPVAGEKFNRTQLTHMANLIERMDKHEFLQSGERESDGHLFKFRSAMIRSCIYTMMVQSQRQQLHLNVALYYERIMNPINRQRLLLPLYEHFRETDDHQWYKKLRYLEQVSHYYYEKNSIGNAIKHYRLLLETVLQLQNHLKIKLFDDLILATWNRELGGAFFSQSDLPMAEFHLLQSLKLLNHPFPSTHFNLIYQIRKLMPKLRSQNEKTPSSLRSLQLNWTEHGYLAFTKNVAEPDPEDGDAAPAGRDTASGHATGNSKDTTDRRHDSGSQKSILRPLRGSGLKFRYGGTPSRQESETPHTTSGATDKASANDNARNASGSGSGKKGALFENVDRNDNRFVALYATRMTLLNLAEVYLKTGRAQLHKYAVLAGYRISQNLPNDVITGRFLSMAAAAFWRLDQKRLLAIEFINGADSLQSNTDAVSGHILFSTTESMFLMGYWQLASQRYVVCQQLGEITCNISAQSDALRMRSVLCYLRADFVQGLELARSLYIVACTETDWVNKLWGHFLMMANMITDQSRTTYEEIAECNEIFHSLWEEAPEAELMRPEYWLANVGIRAMAKVRMGIALNPLTLVNDSERFLTSTQNSWVRVLGCIEIARALMQTLMVSHDVEHSRSGVGLSGEDPNAATHIDSAGRRTIARYCRQMCRMLEKLTYCSPVLLVSSLFEGMGYVCQRNAKRAVKTWKHAVSLPIANEALFLKGLLYLCIAAKTSKPNEATDYRRKAEEILASQVMNFDINRFMNRR